MQNEQVMVIPANLAESLCNYKVFSQPSPILEKIILDSCSFRTRSETETNYGFKQVIPYVMIVHAGAVYVHEDGAESSSTRYLLAQRTTKQQEKRLHNLHSLGQGGHINESDMRNGTDDPITSGLMREIQEEFHLSDVRERALIGAINDNSNDVGRVHLGLLYMLRVGSLAFSVAEEGARTAQWVTADDLQRDHASMENWSKIIYDHVILKRNA